MVRSLIKMNSKNYHKKWYQENKERISTKQKVYFQKHKERYHQQIKNWYEKNKEKLNENRRQKYWENHMEQLIRGRNYYLKNKKQISEKMKRLRIENPEKFRGWYNKYNKNNPLKQKARSLANYYIKIPENQNCEVCKVNKAIERHHEDYSKPFEVNFVCHRCNKKFDRSEE